MYSSERLIFKCIMCYLSGLTGDASEQASTQPMLTKGARKKMAGTHTNSGGSDGGNAGGGSDGNSSGGSGPDKSKDGDKGTYT